MLAKVAVRAARDSRSAARRKGRRSRPEARERMAASDAFSAELRGLSLLGTGERSIKLGFVTIRVYAMALYADSAGLAEALRAAGMVGEDCTLDLGSDAFYRALVQGRFRKTLVLSMQRALPRAKLLESLSKSLLSRVEPAQHSQARDTLEKLCLRDLVLGDRVELELLEDGETFVGRCGELPEVRIVSPGPEGIWAAFQNIYFDKNTELPDIRIGAVKLVPSVLAALASPSAAEETEGSAAGTAGGAEGGAVGKKEGTSGGGAVDPEPQRQERALSKQLAVSAAEQEIGSRADTGSEKGETALARVVGADLLAVCRQQLRVPTWKEATQRRDGEDGYQFGDLVRLTLRRVLEGDLLGLLPHPQPDRKMDERLCDEVAALMRRRDELERRVEQLEREVADGEARAVETASRASLLGALGICSLILTAQFAFDAGNRFVTLLWVLVAVFAIEVGKREGQKAAPSTHILSR